MPRKPLGPRIYFDRSRGQWAIRDGAAFVRTDALDREGAEAELARYISEEGISAQGFIYFLTAAYPEYPIKIGFTQRMASVRIRGLQNAHPYTLYFIGYIPGTMAQEREIHASFDHLRLQGKWFKRDEILITYIRDKCPAARLVA